MDRKRITDYLIAFIIILCLNFFLPRMLPGDPLTAIYGEEALISMTPALKSQLIERFGLDKPLYHQFLIYLTSLAKGDLGYSYYYQTPVAGLILGTLPWTILLVGLALVISTLLGFILGLESGWKRGRPADKAILTGMMFLNGFPDFFIGILLLVIFGVVLGLFPLSGALSPYAGLSGFALLKDILWHLTLPLVSLAVVEISASYLLTRATVISVLGEPFILTARAKGLAEKRIKYRHAGRNSLLPIITGTGIRLGRVFTGALFVEVVFAYPGMGLLVYNSLTARDYPVLQGIFFLVTIGVMGANLLVDLVYKKLDPRVD
ncbi:ABC transporter permease [Calderihabitans maritimus]|uniref:Binding-protein-dependent transport system inner membrane protein n=1 Tax=Calderihabitans maritimus TaxID=1246530 RepID=A0A1Z5HT73_9FIRM|nr:ABC transporter permease [Calderihabitans maritimus]GAW92505.1 binding-protein-dependent transport system inner membrane protein [Calderihabitans maritimus]